MIDDTVRQEPQDQSAIQNAPDDTASSSILDQIDSKLDELEDEQIEWTEDMMPKFETPTPSNQVQPGGEKRQETSYESESSVTSGTTAEKQPYSRTNQSVGDSSGTARKEGEKTSVAASSSDNRPAENVKAVQFDQFAPAPKGVALGNLDLLLDVKMPLVVELGRTQMLIRDILELGPGSVIELDKAAGEPVDLLVNGKLIARGEVVVIDESFGLRITEIVDSTPGVDK